MHHGWLCIALSTCAVFCKAHLYDGAAPSKLKSSCLCTVEVPLTNSPPIEVKATKPKPKAADENTSY